MISWIAALMTAIASAAFACSTMQIDSRCMTVALVGIPGIIVSVVVTGALHGSAHGGGPLGDMLLVATPINFIFFVGVGFGVRAIARLL
jgi:hypothetical protein